MDRVLDRILNEPFQISDDQKIAINSDSKYTRIIAGAGAGKTETLARKILYYLIYKKIPPSSIVAFTFTEKAAQSMKSRIHQRLLSSFPRSHASGYILDSFLIFFTTIVI